MIIADELGDVSHLVSIDGLPWLPDQTGPLAITYGRETAEDRVAPAALTVTLLAPDPATRPRVGSNVTVELTSAAMLRLGLDLVDDAAARRRFTGRVTSARLVMRRQRDDQELAAVVELVAAGTKHRLANIPVGQAPWPSELISARVQRIMDAASAWDVYTTDPLPVGTIETHMTPAIGKHAWAVVEQDVDNQTVLQLIDTLAEDVEGELVELRDGTLTWHGLDHRRGTIPVVELSADDVLADAEWTQELDGLANYWLVPDPDPASGFTYAAYDLASIDRHGPLIVTRTTSIAPDPDNPDFVATAPWDGAAYITRVGLSRHSRPRWVVPTLAVDVLARPETDDPDSAGLSDAQAAAVLTLEYGDLITVTGLPESAPLKHARLWVEGWTETVTRTSWQLGLNVTEYGHTGPAVRWVDLTPPTLTWADLADDQLDGDQLDWLRSGTWFPALPQAGRWLDQSPEATWTDQGALTWQETL